MSFLQALTRREKKEVHRYFSRLRIAGAGLTVLLGGFFLFGMFSAMLFCFIDFSALQQTTQKNLDKNFYKTYHVYLYALEHKKTNLFVVNNDNVNNNIRALSTDAKQLFYRIIALGIGSALLYIGTALMVAIAPAVGIFHILVKNKTKTYWFSNARLCSFYVIYYGCYAYLLDFFGFFASSNLWWPIVGAFFLMVFLTYPMILFLTYRVSLELDRDYLLLNLKVLAKIHSKKKLSVVFQGLSDKVFKVTVEQLSSDLDIECLWFDGFYADRMEHVKRSAAA